MSKKTVAIVGSHPVTRVLAPWTRKYCDIWVFNEAAGQGWVPRADAVFQMHLEPIWKNPANRNDPKHYEWLQQERPYPIYMHEHYPDVPSSVKYPLDEVCAALLGNFARKGKKRQTEEIRYFTSSVCYALALAIHQGYERIELYGVEMATDTEYRAQRDGVTFWTGIALGKGIEVTIPDISVMFNALLYGYEGDIVINKQEFETQAGKMEKAKMEAVDKMNRAGIRVEQAFADIGKSSPEDREGIQKKTQAYLEALQRQQQAILEYGVIEGVLQENERYIAKCNLMADSVGGEDAMEALLADKMQRLAAAHGVVNGKDADGPVLIQPVEEVPVL